VSADLVLRGGRVVDGTGAPERLADVAITRERVTEVGRYTGSAKREIDVSGAVVAPGFIDVHTHYDAQLHWEPTATPSCWHGVTTVLCGNCGFTLTPARSEDTAWLADMLSRVEGMSPAALRDGLGWDGGSFGDYWKRLEGRLGVNAASYVGHSAVRRFVMGDDASVRRARAGEIEAMCDLVRRSLREGALGFSSSQLEIHVAHDGREVPSNHASAEEVLALAAVVGEIEGGSLEFIPRSFVEGYSAEDRRLMLDMARVSRSPLELNLVTPLPADPEGWRKSLEFAHAAHAEGLSIHPMFAANQQAAYFALDSTFLFDELPCWRAILTLPLAERFSRLRDPVVRAELDRDLCHARAFRPYWPITYVEAVRDVAHADWVGRSVADLAAERGVEPLDCFLDLSLEEDLATTFVLRAPMTRDGRALRASMVVDPLLSAGSSDGGAHLLSLVGVDYTTRMITDWVPETISLETAIHRMTGEPASRHGLSGRGTLAAGSFADVVVFDPKRLRVGATRVAHDFPAGSSRLVIDAEGYVMTLVNGAPLLEGGVHTGALPGHFLRGAGARPA